jgi:hypothetical protein
MNENSHPDKSLNASKSPHIFIIIWGFVKSHYITPSQKNKNKYNKFKMQYCRPTFAYETESKYYNFSKYFRVMAVIQLWNPILGV